jgi:hypothetical protein
LARPGLWPEAGLDTPLQTVDLATQVDRTEKVSFIKKFAEDGKILKSLLLKKLRVEA